MKTSGTRIRNDDFMTNGMQAFWGEGRGDDGKEVGRGDLRIMRQLGANAVRLYGNDPTRDHTLFLDEARAQGLDVIAGISDYPYIQMHDNCMHTDFDCYDQIKEQYAKNLQNGFLESPHEYHTSLRTVILINEPDLKLHCKTADFHKALISAFDAVLDAEKEAGVKGQAPNFTITFSFGVCHWCDRLGSKPGIGQMLGLRDAMRDPHSVGYHPRNDLALLYQRRFVNSINTANPSGDIRRLFLDTYDAHFGGTPVFIGEYHSPGHDQVLDLESIMRIVNDPSTLLMGVSFFEYQVRYDKGGAEKGFGMFGLSNDTIMQANTDFGTFKSWCLTPVEASTNPREDCGETEKDLDYVASSSWGFGMDHVASAGECCAKCKELPKCKAWTWVKDAGLLEGCKSQCWVKGGLPIRKVRKLGVVSGLRHKEAGVVQATPPIYIHEALTSAFGGPGVRLYDLCPMTTTFTSSTTRLIDANSSMVDVPSNNALQDRQVTAAMHTLSIEESARAAANVLLRPQPTSEDASKREAGWGQVRTFWR